RQLGEWAGRESPANIEALARQWWHEHGQNPRRSLGLALLARDVRELMQLAEAASQGLSDSPNRPIPSPTPGGERIFYSPQPLGSSGQVAFVFPGSGNHFAGMGRELAAQWPESLRRQDAENSRLRDQFLPEQFWDRDTIFDTVSHRDLIFGQVTLGVLVSDLMRGFGVRPYSVIGYSLGETAGLFAMRAWTARDEMLKRMTSSPLFTTELAGGCTAARTARRPAACGAVHWLAWRIARSPP